MSNFSYISSWRRCLIPHMCGYSTLPFCTRWNNASAQSPASAYTAEFCEFSVGFFILPFERNLEFNSSSKCRKLSRPAFMWTRFKLLTVHLSCNHCVIVPFCADHMSVWQRSWKLTLRLWDRQFSRNQLFQFWKPCVAFIFLIPWEYTPRFFSGNRTYVIWASWLYNFIFKQPG